jgi:LAO/AO transport system kinase
MLDSDKTFSKYLKKLQSKSIDPFEAGDKITKSLLK